MASLLDRFDLVSRLFFVFQSIGSIFLKIPIFITAIKRFVFENSISEASDLELLPNDSFVAECEGLVYLKGFLNKTNTINKHSGVPVQTGIQL